MVYWGKPGGSRVDDLLTILVVEDDPFIQFLVEDALTDGGFELAIAASGEEAVTLLNVRRCERFAIMPCYAFAQLERDGFAVGCGVPAFSENPHRLAFRVEIDERFLNFSADDVNPRGGLYARVELTLLGTVVDVKHATFARRLLCERTHRI